MEVLCYVTYKSNKVYKCLHLTQYTQKCSEVGAKRAQEQCIWALNQKIICKSNKHPKRNHYMFTKWSKKDAHEKWGAGKET